MVVVQFWEFSAEFSLQSSQKRMMLVGGGGVGGSAIQFRGLREKKREECTWEFGGRGGSGEGLEREKREQRDGSKERERGKREKKRPDVMRIKCVRRWTDV